MSTEYDPVEKALDEINADIRLMTIANLLKIDGDLPKEFKATNTSAYQTEAYCQGARTALAHVRRMIDTAKKAKGDI